VASFSDGTHYVNPLLTTNNAPPFNTDFIDLLTQVWNFADATNPQSDNNLIPIIAQTVPVRTYRDPTADGTPKPGQTVIELPLRPSWNKYSQALQLETQPEVPPLPGQDPSIGDDTHHRIRDFMLLDAAVKRIFSGSSLSVSPPSDITFQGTTLHIQRIDLDPVSALEDPTRPEVSLGTGFHGTSGKLLVDTSSVLSNGILDFFQRDVEITLRLYELRDPADQVAPVEPNWFGAAVPDGVTDFSKPILYFHPTPGQVRPVPYDDTHYQAKTAAGVWNFQRNGRDWREVFAYLDRLGNQLAGAIQQGANRNQIIILPFMTSRSANPTGINFLKSNWLAILTNILQDISANPSG
jgi:hypothetical protein